MGPLGFEPRTKGFAFPAVSGGRGLSLHPRPRRPLGCGTLLPVIKGARSPQVVSAPSGGAPPARLRIAISRIALEGFPEFVPSTRPLTAPGHLFKMSPLL